MKRFILCIIISVILLLTACSKDDSNSASEDSDSQVNEVKNTETIDIDEEEGIHDETSDNIHNESISEFLILLNKYFYEEDLKGFQEFIDVYGIYSISYFEGNREKNKAVLVFREDVRENLFLVSSQSGKAGISLSGGTFSTEVNEVYINDYVVENNALQNVGWLVKDEIAIQNQLPDIINGCQELILKNNKYIPQVFSLPNNRYAFSYSDINENAPEKFYGYWIILEEINESYVIRAIIELQ